MEAYKCDLCGEYKEADEPAISIARHGRTERVVHIESTVMGKITNATSIIYGVRHLCDGCWKKVESFMDIVKDDGGESQT